MRSSSSVSRSSSSRAISPCAKPRTELRERRPAPERERLAKLRAALARGPACASSTSACDPVHVELDGLDAKQVAGGFVTTSGPSTFRSCETKFWSESRPFAAAARPRALRSSGRSRPLDPRRTGAARGARAASGLRAAELRLRWRPRAGRAGGSHDGQVRGSHRLCRRIAPLCPRVNGPKGRR